MRFAFLIFGFLAACQADEPDLVLPGPDACGASGLQTLIGDVAADQDFPQARSDLRIIAPNSAVTTDYRPNRLNVETDADGIITRVFCG